MNGNVLHLALKPIFFRAIRIGAKKQEFRDRTSYWTEKLVDIESYGGKSVEDVMEGIYCGELEFKPRHYDRLLFHESGTQRTMMVECLGITYFRGHLGFAIQLGNILTYSHP